MKKKLFLMMMTTALLFCAGSRKAQAQATGTEMETPRYEVGGQLFSFHGHELGYAFGAGLRFSYNMTEHVSLDNEVNFFLPDEGPAYATQFVSGLKVGKRFREKVGIFAKVRPGVQTNFAINGQDNRNKFVVDVGAVFEVYPSRHFTLRFDAGDTIIPFGSDAVGFGVFAIRPGTTHNQQYSIGVNFRF